MYKVTQSVLLFFVAHCVAFVYLCEITRLLHRNYS